MQRNHESYLFDDLVGAGEQRGWYRQAQRRRRLLIDRQFKSGWLLDREISGLGPPEYLVHIVSRSPERGLNTRTIKYQPSGPDHFQIKHHRWQMIRQGDFGDATPLIEELRGFRGENAVDASLPECSKNRFHTCWIRHFGYVDGQSKCFRRVTQTLKSISPSNLRVRQNA